MFERIGIIGAGAIGSIVGGLLTKAGRDVTLVDPWPEHVEAMRRSGLVLSGTCGDHRIPVRALHLCELQAVEKPFDAVFVAVKSYDTEWATQLAVAYLRPDGVVVDFQNGINDHRVAAIAGAGRSLGCVIAIGAGMYEPGHAVRTDRGKLGFKIGEHDGRVTERASRLAEIVGAVAPAQATAHLWRERWSKLAVNCMANPLAGLSGLGSAEVRTLPEPRRIGLHVGAEVVRVARAAGHEVEPIHGITAQRFVDGAEGRGIAELEADMAASVQHLTGGRPSLLQDVMKKRRTEVEYLNGHVSLAAREHGIPTPLNDAVVAEFRRLGIGFEPDPSRLAPLSALLPR